MSLLAQGVGEMDCRATLAVTGIKVPHTSLIL